MMAWLASLYDRMGIVVALFSSQFILSLLLKTKESSEILRPQYPGSYCAPTHNQLQIDIDQFLAVSRNDFVRTYRSGVE